MGRVKENQEDYLPCSGQDSMAVRRQAISITPWLCDYAEVTNLSELQFPSLSDGTAAFVREAWSGGLGVWTQKLEFISQLCHFLCDSGIPL